MLLSFIILTACSNSSDFETGEIKALKNLREALLTRNTPTKILDTRTIITRKKIDDAKIPILFIELKNGQNGTLTLYPGQGTGETWLGADGATLTLERGILKASRGMGDDLMGSSSSMPTWSNINKKTLFYSRELNHITGNNRISNGIFSCDIKKISGGDLIKIWDVNFKVAKFEENCSNERLAFKNVYHVDTQGVVRRSLQYHSDTLGYILLERLDRQ